MIIIYFIFFFKIVFFDYFIYKIIILKYQEIMILLYQNTVKIILEFLRKCFFYLFMSLYPVFMRLFKEFATSEYIRISSIYFTRALER